jgi:uracil-DNA glycosylase family 4
MIDLQNTSCDKCGLCQTRKNVVNGVGPTSAKIVLIGEGPGDLEDRTGQPFQGPAGQLLSKLLREADINRGEVFFTNVVRCIPKAPTNAINTTSKWYNKGVNTREPSSEEIQACAAYLDAEIAALKPNIIVPMGNVALRAVLSGQKSMTITSFRGKETWSERYNCKVIPTIHPSALLRNPKHESTTIEDFKRIKISSEYPELTKQNVGQYVVIDSMELLDDLVERLVNVPAFAFDIETSGFDPVNDKLLCIAFTWKAYTGCTVPLIKYVARTEEYTEIKIKKVKKKVDGVYVTTEKEVIVPKTRIIDEYYPYWGDQQQIVIEKLKKVFSSSVCKIAHNGKFDIKFLLQAGIDVENFYFDTMLAHYCLDENAEGLHGLKDCAIVYTDMGDYDSNLNQWFEERGIADAKRNYAHLPTDMLYSYNAKDTDCTFRLYEKFAPLLEKEGLESIFYRLLMPLSITLMNVERDGILIDLQQLKKDLSAEQISIEQKIKQQVGDINLRSPKQLRELFFEKLKLPITKYTKPLKGSSPQPSTDEEALEFLSSRHEVPKLLLEYRKLEKLLGTYVSGIEEALDCNNRIHSTFLIHIAATGRLSSRNPNLQNIPRDDKRIKKLFISRPGWKFIEADYGQAEFRHWANYSQDPKMIADIVAATNGTGPDIHILTASDVWKIPVETVTKAQRQQAKSTVFGVMYGRGAKSVAEEYGYSEIQAQNIINVFFAKYPIAKAWLDAAIATTRTYGRIRNIFGRLRRLPSINSQDKMMRAEAERQAVNSPIQSAASDMNCNAANRIMLRLKNMNYHGVLCLLVHDSLFFEVPDSEVKETLNIIKTEMERPIENVTVPMQAELKIGTRWGELEEIIEIQNEWFLVKEKETGDKEEKVKEKYKFEKVPVTV